MRHRMTSLARAVPPFVIAAGLCLALPDARGQQPPRPTKPGAGAKAAPPKEKSKERPKEKPLVERLKSPYDPDLPPAEKLRSPRETFKVLYYAVITYDLFPQMMEDIVATLDLDAVQPRPSPESALLLGLDLERVLQSLDIPLTGVPDQADQDALVVYEAAGYRVGLRRGPDGGWRFDAD